LQSWPYWNISRSTSTDKEFHLRIDHLALIFLIRFKNLEGQNYRRFQRLQEYSFGIEHNESCKRSAADALLQRPFREEYICHKIEAWTDVKQALAIAAVPAAGCNPAVLNDLNIWPILEELEAGQRPEKKSPTAAPLKNH
jgi:hypothetical protein